MTVYPSRILDKELQENISDICVKYKIVQIFYVRDFLLIKIVSLLLLYMVKPMLSLTWFLVEGVDNVIHRIIETAMEATLQTTESNLLANQQ